MTRITKTFLFYSSSPPEEGEKEGGEHVEEGEQEGGEHVGEGEQEGGEHVGEGEQEGGEHVTDGSQDGGEFSSDSEGLDIYKVFKEWQELKDGHQLER